MPKATSKNVTAAAATPAETKPAAVQSSVRHKKNKKKDAKSSLKEAVKSSGVRRMAYRAGIVRLGASAIEAERVLHGKEWEKIATATKILCHHSKRTFANDRILKEAIKLETGLHFLAPTN